MHPYQERDGDEDRKPGGKTRVKRYGTCVVNEEDLLDRTKLENDRPTQNHSDDPQMMGYARREEEEDSTIHTFPNV